MKRLIAGVALASAATLITAVPAQAAAPKNPLVAVKKQLVPGKGVKFTERTTINDPDTRMIFVRRSGTIAFRKNGLAASDSTGKLNINASDLGEDADEFMKAMASSERTIWLGKTSYLSGGIWTGLLPEDKKWFKMPNGPTGGVTGLFGQPLNVVEPATLRAMLKNAKATKDGYAGKITVSQVRKASPWFRATVLRDEYPAKVLKTEISWRLSVNAKGLPTRLVSTFPFGIVNGTPKKSETVSVDTRYTNWGTKVSIKAPTTSDASDKPKDGQEDALENFDFLDGLNVSTQ